MRWLGALLLLHVVLGVTYSLVTPVFEASDERWHYPVARHLADTGQLPVQDPGQRTDWHQEGSQPPLYYLVAAALTAGIDTSDFPAVYTPNPHAVVGEPLVVGNKNMMIHPRQPEWPWQGTVLAVHLIRLLSVGLGAVTVWLTYRLAYLVWPADTRVALLAAALTAFNPMFIFIGASVNNDNLAAPLAAGAMVVLLTALQRGSPLSSQGGGQRLRDGAALGILLGLGAITKLSVLALVPLVALALTWDAARGHRQGRSNAWRTCLANLALIGGLMLLIGGWWYWRNWTLYADPTGLNRMLEIAGRRHEALTLDRLWYEFEGFRITYWGLFGTLNILLDRWIYSALDLLVATAGVGVGMACARAAVLGIRTPALNARDIRPRLNPPLLLLGAWVLLVFISLIRWTSQTYASQGRLMFVVIGGLSTLFAVGLLALAPGRLRTLLACGVGGGLFLLSAISPFYYIAPTYARPLLLNETQLPGDVQRVNWNVNGELRLLGYRIEPTAAGKQMPTLRPFETLPVTVYWQVLAPMMTDYSVFVHLLGRERTVVGQVNTYPGLGLWPTTQLQPGDVVADTYRVPVAADAAAPTLLRVHAGVYRYDDPGRPALEALDTAGRRVEPWLTTVKLIPWDWPEVAPTHRLQVRLGESISLLGYDLATAAAGATDKRTLTLYWRAEGRPTADYTVFIQVWDAADQVAGFDGRPVNGNYPTDWWEAGETIVDGHALDLSALPAGRYRLLVGMYRLETGERVPATDPAGLLPNYAIELDLEKE